MKKIILLFCLYCISPIYAQIPNYVPANGLVAYYPFNGNANDFSGNGNNGVVNSANLTSDRFGNANNAYSFDGIASGILIPYSSIMSSLVGNFSVSFWIKNNLPLNHLGAHIWHRQDGCFDFAISSDNKINYGKQGISNILSSNAILQNTWTSVLYTKSGNEHKVYINGVLDNSTINNITLIDVVNDPLKIGYASPGGNGGSYRFNGDLDDFIIYNRALTQQEITNLYYADTTCQSLVINTGILSFNPVTYTNTVTIYPNPANDHITIDCGTLANVSGWNIVITNTLGQEVFNQPMNTQQYVVPLNTWSGQGVYFVKIYDAQGNLVNTKKIILQ
jgi:hypothetical protein